MDSIRQTTPAVQTPLARFLQRVRQVVSHDLRTPLGTIVNYATVLEAAQGAGSDDVRDLGRRIRKSAQRSARMVQLLVTVIGLASRSLESSPTDLKVLARSILGDAGGHGAVRLSPASQAANVDVDAEVVGFAWRAYLATESDAAGKPIDEAVLRIQHESGAVVLDLQCGPDPTSGESDWKQAEKSDLSGYLRFSQGPSRLENSMGLGLAEELVLRHGGLLGIFGKPGSGSGLRVRLPVTASANA